MEKKTLPPKANDEFKQAQIEAKLMRDAYFQLKDSIKAKQKTEQALEASEKRFEKLIDQAPLGIYFTDPKGNFLGANKAAEKMSGYKSKDLKGKILPELRFLPKEQLKEAREIIKKNRKGLSTGPDTFDLKTKRGERRKIKLYTSVVNTNSGTIFMRMIDDVTDIEEIRKKLEENEHRYSTIASQTGQLLYDLDIDSGKIIWFGAINQVTGYTKEEFQKVNVQRWKKLIHPQDKEQAVKELNQAIKSAKEYSIEYRLRRKDDSYVDIQDRGIFEKKKGKAFRMLGVMIDITPMKQLNRIRNDFVNLASHQLRTPMTAIRWNLELLEEAINPKNKNAKSYLSDLKDASARMNSLVHDLLNISYIDSGKMKITPQSINIVSLLSDVIEEYSYLADSKNIKVQYTSSAPSYRVKLDKRIFSRAIGNIIENAIKYSKDNSKVRIVLKKVRNGYKITVSDKGIGISKEDQPFVFDKFFRGKNTTYVDTEGSGLGLPVAKNILEQSGCEISFKSKLDEGTTFSIKIPARGMKPTKGPEEII